MERENPPSLTSDLKGTKTDSTKSLFTKQKPNVKAVNEKLDPALMLQWIEEAQYQTETDDRMY